MKSGTIYSWRNDRMSIFSRDNTNEAFVHIEGVTLDMSHQISKALERIFADGVCFGKQTVVDAVHRVTDEITR